MTSSTTIISIILLLHDSLLMKNPRIRLPVPFVVFNGDFNGVVFSPMKKVPEAAFQLAYLAPLGDLYTTVKDTQIYYINRSQPNHFIQNIQDLPPEILPFFNNYNEISSRGIFRDFDCPSDFFPVCGGMTTYSNICSAAKAGLRKITFGKCGVILKIKDVKLLKKITSYAKTPSGQSPPIIIERPVKVSPDTYITNNYINAPTITNVNAPSYTNTDGRSYTNVSAPSYSKVDAPSYSSTKSLTNTNVQAPSYSSTIAPSSTSIVSPSYSSNVIPLSKSIKMPSSISISAPLDNIVGSPVSSTELPGSNEDDLNDNTIGNNNVAESNTANITNGSIGSESKGNK